MKIGLLFRTIRYLKLRQLWYQVWRRIQKALETHPKCSDAELPEFTFLNLTARPKGWNDESLDMLWRYNLHYFDAAGNINAEAQRRGERRDFERLIERWIKDNPRGSVPGWDPYPTSLRIVNWVKWVSGGAGFRVSGSGFRVSGSGFRVSGDECQVSGDEFRVSGDECRVSGDELRGPGCELDGGRELIEKSIAQQLEWLANHVEWHIMANHLLANLKALVIGNKWLGRDCGKWMCLYKKQIAEQILPDGGHFERSVMYHAIILEDVLDVMRFCGDDGNWLKPVAEKMLRYLVNMTGPDGKIAMFNDAADGIAKSTAWLCDYASRLGVEVPDAKPFADFPGTGYTRMTAGGYVVFVDTAPIGPDYQPGHAHADTLTYELYYKGQKVVTDVGTSEYRGNRRAYERSTAAHNVVEVDGRNSSEVWSSHRVGARARIVEREVEPGRIYAAHDGYGFKVCREMCLTENGLEVKEKVDAKGKRECVTRVHGNVGMCKCGNVEITNGRCVHGEVDEFEYAVEFGKLAKGKCISMRFKPGEEFGYAIRF